MENYRYNSNEVYIANRFGLFTVYIPLGVYLITLIATMGLAKGFITYSITSPFSVGMIMSIVSYNDNKTFYNLVKTIIINTICVLCCLSIICIFI